MFLNIKAKQPKHAHVQADYCNIYNLFLFKNVLKGYLTVFTKYFQMADGECVMHQANCFPPRWDDVSTNGFQRIQDGKHTFILSSPLRCSARSHTHSRTLHLTDVEKMQTDKQCKKINEDNDATLVINALAMKKM